MNIVRLVGIEIENLKNVKSGLYQSQSRFGSLQQADIVGFYGENGTGKTAMIKALEILAILLAGEHKSLPKLDEYLIYYGEEKINLCYQFIVHIDKKEYYLNYSVVLCKGKDKLKIDSECLKFKENKENEKSRVLVEKNKKGIKIGKYIINQINKMKVIDILVVDKIAEELSTSFIFYQSNFQSYKELLTETEYLLFSSLSNTFSHNLHIVKTTNRRYLIENIIMPISMHYKNTHGQLPFPLELDEGLTGLLPKPLYTSMNSRIDQINEVLPHIARGLMIDVNFINEENLPSGEVGVRFQFLGIRENRVLPLKVESNGTLKIIAILSALIATYHNPNACIVIDELDVEIFEFLLGELIEIIQKNGQGQLIFTSHNLRILEVLPIENLWFSTSNPYNRYVQLIDVVNNNNSNNRDSYIRELKLGNQKDLQVNLNTFKIKKAFRKTKKMGRWNHENLN